MANIVIHIGRHKSGTSALQDMLFSSKELLEKEGWYYPATGMKNIAHHGLAHYFIEKQKGLLPADPGILRKLEEEISDKENVIISSEAFQNITKPEKIKLSFEKHSVKIIVYIREQVEYLLSAYAQAIHARKVTDSIDLFEKTFHADYEVFLKKWENIFGKENIIVRVYNRGSLIDGDIIHDFFDVTGLGFMKDSYVVGDKERNPSIGAPSLNLSGG